MIHEVAMHRHIEGDTVSSSRENHFTKLWSYLDKFAMLQFNFIGIHLEFISGNVWAWYQPRHVLVCSWVVRCYSLFACPSEAERVFYRHVHFQILCLLVCGVTATCIWLPLGLLMTIKAYLLLPLLGHHAPTHVFSMSLLEFSNTSSKGRSNIDVIFSVTTLTWILSSIPFCVILYFRVLYALHCKTF